MAGWRCAGCGGENSPGTTFCGHCGRKAETTSPNAVRSAEEIAEAVRSYLSGPLADRLVTEGGKLEERRLVTALFADLSGFTPLADRLDPEQLLEIIDPVLRRLSEIVGRYEGYVDKFAGDAVFALFGAPVSHEDDADRALHAATDMHRELKEMTGELPLDGGQLALRIGVNSGHGIARTFGSSIRMDYSVLSDAVILAQRLQSAAPNGATYVGESTHALVSDRFELDPVGDLALKGKAGAVRAWALRGAKPRAHTPKRAKRQVARETEVAAATRALDRLASGVGGVLTIAGEPGVGKSRLLEEVAALARARDLTLFEGRCVSFGTGLAYRPYIDLIREIAGAATDEPAEQVAERIGLLARELGSDEALPFLNALLALPNAAGTENREGQEAFRRWLQAAVAGLVRRLASRQPLILAIEDLHWADPSSLELTHELLRVCGDARLLVLLTARTRDTLMDITRSVPNDNVTEIKLRPLSTSSVGQLVESLLGGPPPEDLVSAICERTAGNPFFIEETVRALVDSGTLVQSNGVWTSAGQSTAWSVPVTVEAALSARIDLLPAHAARLLKVASVIGRRVSAELLWAAAGEPAPALDLLNRLIEGGFLHRSRDDGDDLVTFHHSLVQDVAYSRLLRRQQRDLHRAVADGLERLYGTGDDIVDVLARHMYLGEAGTRAVRYLVQAAQRARRLFANEEAAVHYGHALELARADPACDERLPDILLELADINELRGRYDEALPLYAEAQVRGGDVRAWRGGAMILRLTGRYAEAHELLDRAFVAKNIAETDTRALWLERGWSLTTEGRVAEATKALEEGLGRSTVRDATTGRLLLQLARAHIVAGNYERALEYAAEATSLFEDTDDPRGLATALRVLGDAHTNLGHFDAAAAALRRGLELAERVGSAEEIGGCLINLGLVELRREAVEEAIVLTRRAIDQFERIGHGSGRAIGFVNLASMLDVADRLDEALSWGEKALELSTSLGNDLSTADALDTLAHITLHRGDYDSAAAYSERAATMFVDLGAIPSAVESLEIAAQAADELGDGARARANRFRARSLNEDAS